MLSRILRFCMQNRPGLLFLFLVSSSLISIGSGAEATYLGAAFRNAVSTVAYPFIIGFQRVGDSASQAAGVVVDYNSLQAQNEELQWKLAHMADLVARGEEAIAHNAALGEMIEFERAHPRVELLPARVVGVERGMITIDVGTIADVAEGMCVMTPAGIIGIVTAVTPFSSTVISLHHSECRIAVKVQRSRVRGVLKGSGNRYTHYCELQFIGQHDDVMKGDILVTSEESRFPAGYRVGQLATAPGGGSLLVTAPVTPYVNPYAVDQVFIVRSAATERVPMAAASDAPASAYALPDDRPLQERFAP